MDGSTNVTYEIDGNDRITAVNDAWVAFARANAGEHLLPPAIIGSSLWRWVTDLTTELLYRSLLKRVRSGAGPVIFGFRCDSPTERRLLEMRLDLGEGGGVTFETRPLEIQHRAGMPLLDARRERSDAMVTICAWCMRVAVDADRWVEIESAIAPLKLFDRSPLPRLSHGMCPGCYAAMVRTLDTTKPAGGIEVTVGRLHVP